MQATICSEASGTGTCKTFTGSVSSVPLALNDQASWVKVEALDGNLAFDAAVLSSSSYEAGGWHMRNIVDGKTTSDSTSYGWASFVPNSSNHTEWIQISLPEQEWFNEVTLYPRTDVATGFPVDFKIQVWNGTQWLDRSVNTSYPQPSGAQSFSWGFSDYTDKIRIYATNLRQDPNGYYVFELAEVQVHNL